MLNRLNAHREWANQKTIEWHLALPHSEDYCHKMISHIVLSEEAWLMRLRGKPAREVWQVLSREELQLLYTSNNAGFREALQSDLSRQIRYRRFDGAESQSTLSDILTHACAHGVYHRGQIAAQAARLGLKPVPTDFIIFARSH